MITGKQVVCNYEGIVKLDATAYGVEQARDIKRLRKYLPEKAKVLDIGCGFGQPTEQAAQFFDVSACDIANNNYKEFYEMLLKMRGIDFKWIDGDKLPYPDASFDGLLLYAVIEHVKDKESLLRECARVLKPNGKIFIFRAVNKRAFAEHFARMLNLASHGDEVVTESQLRHVFTNSGFRIDELGYQGWLPESGLPRWPIYWINKVLVRIPLVNMFSHDYWLIATKSS